jgi:hypothetical protein
VQLYYSIKIYMYKYIYIYIPICIFIFELHRKNKIRTNINQIQYPCLSLLQHDTFADKKVQGFVDVL